MKQKTLLFLTLLAGLLLTACGGVRIGRILADPTRFRNKTVNVDGTVVTSYGALGTGAYQIEDGTGRIYVISNTGVPSKGSRVKVNGTVLNGINVMGRSFGTAIREYHHKIR